MLIYPKHLLVIMAATLVAMSPLQAAAQATRESNRNNSTAQCSDARQVKINRCTNSPYYGNERNFYHAKDAGQDEQGGYENILRVNDNETVLMRVILHNNADPKIRNSAARNVRVSVDLEQSRSKRHVSSATITSSNSSPQTIRDTTVLSGIRPFTVSYVPGSTVYYKNKVGSRSLSDGITRGGVQVPDLQAGTGQVSMVVFKVRINMTNEQVKRDQPQKSGPVQRVQREPREPVVRERPVRQQSFEPQEPPRMIPFREKEPVVKTRTEPTPQVKAKERKRKIEPVVKQQTQPEPQQPVEPVAPAPVIVQQQQTQTQSTPPEPVVVDQPEPVVETQAAGQAPAEEKLPETGMAASGAIGSTAIGYALVAYRRSRKSMRDILVSRDLEV